MGHSFYFIYGGIESLELATYQDDFLTPGILPSLANSLKQILQRPKSLMNPCFLPHLKHRLTDLTLNLGFLAARALTDVLAI